MNKQVPDHSRAKLTKNQTLVMQALLGADGPLSAYSILERLQEHGLSAAPQVYRALDKLVTFGMVHRLESLNAFLACRNPSCGAHTTVAFSICDQCGQVREFSDAKLTDHIESIAHKSDFSPSKTMIELRGTCAQCQEI